MNKPPPPPATVIDRADFELECVREFSHSGGQLGGNVSRAERRERIRVAIMRENKQDARWRDTLLTYAAVYQLVYNMPIEARRSGPEEALPALPARARPIGEADDEEFDDDQEDAI